MVGYECTTEGAVYVTVDKIEPDAAKQKVDENCDGREPGEDDDNCRATVRFVPHSFTTSGVIEPGRTRLQYGKGRADVLSFRAAQA